MVISYEKRGLVGRLIATVLMASLGCEGSADDLPREAVSGVVNLDGQPLAAGAIQFFPAPNGGGVAVGGGGTIENGQFSIARANGLVPGRYNVAINAAEPESHEKRTKGAARKKVAPIKDLIPAKYNVQTTLTADIQKGGTSSLTFDLQSQ
jgi:hypothetical protein